MMASNGSTDAASENRPAMFEVLRARRIFSLGYYFKSFLTEGPFTFVWIVVNTHPTLSAAQQQAADLSLKESSATFVVREPGGEINDWYYDRHLSARRQRGDNWLGTLLTAILLATASYWATRSLGFPVADAAIIAAVPGAIHLVASANQNRRESLVVWCIVVILTGNCYPILQKAKQRRENARASQAQPQVNR